MNINEFTVCVEAALLIHRRLRGPGAYDRVRRFPEGRANATGSDDDRVGRERTYFHRAQVHRADAAADLLAVKHRRQELPVLVLLYLAFGLVTAHLFIERIQQLLPSGRSGKGRTVVQSSAEAAEIKQSFRRAIEGHAHSVEQIDDPGRGLAHVLDRWLVAEEVASVNSVVKMLPCGVAFALQILRCVNATLRADRMRALHRNNREQVALPAHLGDLDDRRESCESAAHDNDSGSCHVIAPPFGRPHGRLAYGWTALRRGSGHRRRSAGSGTSKNSQSPRRRARERAPGTLAAADSAPYRLRRFPT